MRRAQQDTPSFQMCAHHDSRFAFKSVSLDHLGSIGSRLRDYRVSIGSRLGGWASVK
jgi:hypothetical protein